MASPLWQRIYHLYRDGFREMGSLGRTLWIVILLKLFIMFAILRVFFFPDPMARMDREQKSDMVLKQLLNRQE